jgi:hypothetical protein
MRKLIVAVALGVLALGAVQLASVSQAWAIDCSAVRCMACPDGYHFAPTHKNCCRCLPN